MSHRSSRAALAVLLLLTAFPAHAAPASKLDARCRAAVARLRAGTHSIEVMRRSGVAIDRDGALSVFIRGSVTRQELEAAGARVHTALPGLFTASLKASAVDRVAALDGVNAIRAGAPCAPELNLSVPTTGAQLLRGSGPAFPGVNGQGVLVGFVDSGVDYGHGDFKDSLGATRIINIWDQTVLGSGPPGSLFLYGKEWTQAQIDAGTSLQVDTLEHGTHTAGIAAGDGSQTGGATPAFTFTGMAPRADLIVVKTSFFAPEILDAVQYVFDKATARGQNAVVNLSLGTQFGSHDGQSEFEQGLNALTGPGRIVVKSAGNDRGKAVHAEVFATAPGASATVSVAGSAVDRSFEIDAYYNSTERLRVRVTTPNGTVIGPVLVETENEVWPGQDTQNGRVYVNHDSLDAGRKNVLIQVSIEQASRNMNGTWTITFLADQLGPSNGEVDLWRHYADPGVTANFVTGNQPTEELVTEPGNAPGVITVGAWVTKTSWTGCNGVVHSYPGMPAAGNLAPFSSPGMTRDGRLKPDLTAPGTAIGSTTSFDVSLSCPTPPTGSEYLNDGMNHRMRSGTSLSAPHVTGAVALLLQKFGALDPAQVKTYLQANAIVDGFTGAVPSKDWGHGKLKLGDLTDPTVQVFSPNDGETLLIGDTASLTWSASDVLGSIVSVDLQLSRTGPGGPFEDIALGLLNSGTHDWTVTGPTTSSAYLLVRAHDTSANVGSDLSDAAFSIITPPVGVAGDDDPVPTFALARPSPNPTSGGTQVGFAVPRESRVRLSIHDLQGRTVAVLMDGIVPAGHHRATWEGRLGGSRAPAGLYFVRYDTPEGRLVRRLAVAR